MTYLRLATLSPRLILGTPTFALFLPLSRSNLKKYMSNCICRCDARRTRVSNGAYHVSSATPCISSQMGGGNRQRAPSAICLHSDSTHFESASVLSSFSLHALI